MFCCKTTLCTMAIVAAFAAGFFAAYNENGKDKPCDACPVASCCDCCDCCVSCEECEFFPCCGDCHRK